MNASSTDSRRVCAFRLSCFVFCEITASLPSCRPSGRSFCILVPDTPGPEFVGNSRERARRSPARGFQRLQAPLGGRSKADHAAGSFARRSGKADRATRTSSRRSAKADRAARTSSRRSAKADNGGRLCPAQGFSGRAAGRNGALPYNARKSQFLRNGDVWATESLFLFAVLWLAFLPDQSETGVAGGEKPAARTPAAPRRPAQRPRPAPGFCAASANARPGDPAPVRLLEKALWVPPTTEPFRPAPSGKPERKKERRNPG